MKIYSLIIILFEILLPNNVPIGDVDISAAVKRELVARPEVSAHMIDVKTRKGVVLLSGTVDHLLAKEKTEQIAMRVKGVRSVTNEIEVKKPARADEALKSDIENALRFDPATVLYKVDVEVQDGKATLTGTVDSWQQKQFVQKLTTGVKGLLGIENNIRFNVAEGIEDEKIEMEIKQMLRNSSQIDDALINVKVQNGVANLSGITASAAEKEIAEYYAWARGVKKVQADELKVEHWTRDKALRKGKYVPKPDEEIVKAIKSALSYDPRMKSFTPEIQVNKGEVVLSGTTDNLRTKRAAEENARDIVGVFSVYNRIEVRPEEKLSDDKVGKMLLSAIKWDPYLENHSITVNVSNGKAYLSGNVNKVFEKRHLEEIAAGIRGVAEIENNVVVNIPTPQTQKQSYYKLPDEIPPAITGTVKTDREIKQDIEQQFWWSPYLNKKEISVEVENGTATLTGKVTTYREKLKATENAFQGGAMEVINNIVVEYTPEGIEETETSFTK